MLSLVAQGGAVIIEARVLARLGIGVVLPRAGTPVVASAATLIDGFRATDDLGAALVVLGNCTDATPRQAIRRLAALPVGIVVLAGPADTSAAIELCTLGAHAVLDREASEEELATAVHHALLGERYVPPRILGSALGPGCAHRPGQRPRFALTQRERAVLAELAAGRSNQEIADQLCIGAETVKTHLTNIYAKLAVRRRHQAVGIALQHGLV